ncbi:MAG: transglycosylase SLT domain-containing protein [Acidobacteriota bacterium]
MRAGFSREWDSGKKAVGMFEGWNVMGERTNSEHDATRMTLRGRKARKSGTLAILTATALAAFLTGCGRQLSPSPLPTAAAPPIAQPQAVPVTTIDEARSLRANARLDEYERGLVLLTTSSDPRTAHRALALLGLFQMEQNRPDAAAATLAQAAAVYPEIAPFLRLRLIDLEEQRGHFARAADIAAQIIATNGDSSAAALARLRLPAQYAAAGDVASTDSSFRQAMATPVDELTEEEFVRLAKRLTKANRPDLANAILMRLLTGYTGGRFTEDTFDHLVSQAGSPLELLPLDASIDLASKLARADRYDQALDLLARIRTRFPEAPKSAAYRSVRYRALFHSRRYTDLLTETAADNQRDAATTLMRARAAWRVGRTPEFLSGLRELERTFPASREAVEAKILRAKYYVTDETNYELSLVNLKAAIDAGAVGGEGENLWNLGWTYALAGRSDEALRTFDRYVKTFPDGDYKSNSLFWSGKLRMRAGGAAIEPSANTGIAIPPAARADFQQVIAEYPYSYFAYRARQIMDNDVPVPAAAVRGEPFPDVDAALASVTDPRLATVRELLAIDLPRDASQEMKTLAAAYPDNLGVAYALADVYVQGGEPFKANGILQRRFRNFVRHGGTNVPQRFWQILFPLNHWDTIRNEAGRRNIDPYLVASIIRQESGFEASIVSNAGAVGLMQIMPAEAASIATKAGIPGVDRTTLFLPDTNIAVGAAEFRQKLDLMHDNTTLAIAAYNAGEDAVGRWLARTPVDDVDVFVESIPYAETRLYVKTVLRNRFEYRRIYEGLAQQQGESQPARSTH